MHVGLSSLRTRWQGLGAATLAALLCLPMLPALAGSLQVTPISLEFAPEEQAQGLWLSNSGTQPIRAQVRVQQWTQADGTEALAATDALVASPPILEIAAGQRQLVRIVRREISPMAQEVSYRLLVDELPVEEAPDASGLQFLLRYSVPVFALPTGATPTLAQSGTRPPTDLSALSGSWQAQGESAQLTLRNGGRQRIRISQLTHVAPDGQRTPVVPGLLGYVLAGQQMQWTVSLPVPARTGGTFQAKFNDDQEERPLPLPGTGR
jgi:fimbrial chaperone protein